MCADCCSWCHFYTAADNFKQHFERFGKVVEAQIMVDHTSGRSRGFG
jgi:RNA recognition motif-containing protein